MTTKGKFASRHSTQPQSSITKDVTKLREKADLETDLLDIEEEFSVKTKSSLESVTTNKEVEKISKANIFNAVCLVVGTAIGGGFLALPSAVLPIGFYPSFVALFGIWGYLLALSYTTVESIVKLHEEKKNKSLSQREATSSTGLLAVSSSVFGRKTNIIVASMMICLLNSILVIQISRVGLLFPTNYRLATVTAVMSLSALVFGTDKGISFASKSNSILTILFCLSASALFGTGLQSADWTRLSATGSMEWGKIPSAIPVLLYTMVYFEILPTICELLKYKKRPIRIAIFLGSLVIMGLMVGWSALATALIQAGSINSIDPVAVLLSTPGMVRLPLLSLSVTAILTTMIGGYLALISSCKDILGNKIESIRDEKLSRKMRMKLGTLITVPSMLVAASSPTIYLRAIAFSGKYPVLILAGVLPPLIGFLQRVKERSLNENRLDASLASILALGSISVTMLAVNIKNDLASILMKIFNLVA